MQTGGATPKVDHFRVRAEVKPKSIWNIWIEVNLAGDFNSSYLYYDMEKGLIDDHYIGQPSLVYKSKIKAEVGVETEPDLFAQSKLDPTGEKVILEPVTNTVTTARDIFELINIKVIRPKPRYLKKNYDLEPNILVLTHDIGKEKQ